jgi:hypothetical protein
MAFFGKEYLMLVTPIAFLLAGYAIMSRSRTVRMAGMIAAVLGFIAFCTYNFITLGMYSNPNSPYFGDPAIVQARWLEIISDAFVMISIILACVSAKESAKQVQPSAGYAMPNYAGRQYGQTAYPGQPQYGQSAYPGQPSQPDSDETVF